VEHEFVYPIVRPLPPRGIDVAPELGPSSEGPFPATVSLFGLRRPNAGPADASVHGYAHPAQAPRMQAW
jgi:hypothetical protein